MPPIFSIFKAIQPRRILALGILQLFMFVGLLLVHPAQANADNAFQPLMQSDTATYLAETPVETKRKAKEIEKAANSIHKGLDTTKKIIGKNESRNQAIEFGRDKARQKLKALSTKVEASEGQLDRSLSPTEGVVVDHIDSNQ